MKNYIFDYNKEKKIEVEGQYLRAQGSNTSIVCVLRALWYHVTPSY